MEQIQLLQNETIIDARQRWRSRADGRDSVCDFEFYKPYLGRQQGPTQRGSALAARLMSTSSVEDSVALRSSELTDLGGKSRLVTDIVLRRPVKVDSSPTPCSVDRRWLSQLTCAPKRSAWILAWHGPCSTVAAATKRPACWPRVPEPHPRPLLRRARHPAAEREHERAQPEVGGAIRWAEDSDNGPFCSYRPGAAPHRWLLVWWLLGPQARRLVDSAE